jgi:hypothetical protein
MNAAERRRLAELQAKASRRRAELARARRLELAERVRLALTGLARLWASRRLWRRLELEAARQAERDGRRRLQAAWWGTWARVGPQPSTLWEVPRARGGRRGR